MPSVPVGRLVGRRRWSKARPIGLAQASSASATILRPVPGCLRRSSGLEHSRIVHSQPEPQTSTTEPTALDSGSDTGTDGTRSRNQWHRIAARRTQKPSLFHAVASAWRIEKSGS